MSCRSSDPIGNLASGLGRAVQGVAIPVSPSTSDAGVAAARLGRHDAETVAVRSLGLEDASGRVVDSTYRNQFDSRGHPEL